MNIGIDARLYGIGAQGIGRYTEMLVRGIAAQDTKNTYTVFVREGMQIQDVPPHVRVVSVAIPQYHWREQLVLPFILNRYNFDLVHFTHFNVPLLYRRPYVVTIHDLILRHFVSARVTTRSYLRFILSYALFRVVLANLIHTAIRIITVSQYSADDITDLYPRARGKITVIPLAAELLQVTVLPSAIIAKPYYIYVGNAYPHKNLEFLIRSFSKIIHDCPDLKLVLVGKKDVFYQRLQDWSESQGFGFVHFFGAASDKELASLYSHACAFVSASLYEGFGMPALEATTYGLPVIVARSSAFPEVVGDCAYFFDPNDERTCADALLRIYTDSVLRKSMSEKSKQIPRRYSWERTARRTVELYDIAISLYNTRSRKSK